MQRRQLILMQAATALGAAGGSPALARAHAHVPVHSAPPTGSISDFDFLAGEWRIANRRLKAPGEWDEFPAEATVTRLLEGMVSVEELRIPARGFAGMGLRVFDPKARLWRDIWMNAKHGVVEGPGMAGGFAQGAGVFEADDRDGEQAIKVRGTWDQISPGGCRWRQSVSRDGGASWEDNWLMLWQRVADHAA